MDPRAGSRARHSVQRQLLVVARSEENAPPAGREIGIAAPENAGARARVDSDVAERAPRERKSAHQFVRVASESGDAAESSGARNLYSSGTATRPGSGRGERCPKSEWREFAHR